MNILLDSHGNTKMYVYRICKYIARHNFNTYIGCILNGILNGTDFDLFLMHVLALNLRGNYSSRNKEPKELEDYFRIGLALSLSPSLELKTNRQAITGIPRNGYSSQLRKLRVQFCNAITCRQRSSRVFRKFLYSPHSSQDLKIQRKNKRIVSPRACQNIALSISPRE